MRLRALSIATTVGTLALMGAYLGCHTQPNARPEQPDATPLASASAAASASVDAGPAAPINATPFPTSQIANAVNPAHLPAYDGPTGVVEGTIFVTGDPAPPQMGRNFSACPDAAKTYAKVFREGAALANGARPLADAMVGITGYSGYYVPERHESQRIFIRDCAYSTRTVVLTYGQALEVQNKTQGLFMYAPELENQPHPALMMAPPNADPVRLYPAQIGRYRLVDRAKNDWMEADIYVIGHPLHAVTDEQGHYRIEGVPVGKLKVAAQHPDILTSPDAGNLEQDVRADVEVQSGIVSHVDLTIPFAKVAPRPATREHKPALP